MVKDARGATEVREVLSNAGFYEVWLNQGVQNINVFLKIFKQRLIDIFFKE